MNCEDVPNEMKVTDSWYKSSKARVNEQERDCDDTTCYDQEEIPASGGETV